jgi:peptidyl-tRNA hydrolase
MKRFAVFGNHFAIRLFSCSLLFFFSYIGLGNPGAEFVSTRHNVGFECVDLLLQRLLFKQHPTETLFGNTASKCKYSEVAIESHNKLLYLVQPQTFMNRSGSGKKFVAQIRLAFTPRRETMMMRGFFKGVRGFMEQFQIPRKNILVISDDIRL